MPNDLAIKNIIEAHRTEIISRLPTYITPEQFFQIAYSLERNHKLAAAARANPDSLLNAIFRAADCGLLPSSGFDHCWLIPYGNEIQFQVGWRGLVYQLVHAGAVLKISASCVYVGDLFKLELGDEERLVHEPNLHDEHRREAKWLADKKNLLGAYAVAWLPDPLRRLKQYRWVPLGEIEAARMRSKVPDGPAWTHDFPAMAIKTAVRRVCKLIEVCGPTPENKEAWERFGRTIEVEKSEYKNLDEDDEPADMPGNPPSSAAPSRKSTSPSGRRAEGSGAKAASPTQDGESSGQAKAPPPPPPPPPKVDEPISEDMQNKLWELMKLAGMKPTALLKHVKELYGLPTLEGLKSSQAAELEKYLKNATA